MTGWRLSRAWRRRLPWLGVALFIGYLVFIGWTYLEGQRRALAGGTPLFTDYTSTYAASMLMRARPPAEVYVTRAMARAELEAARAAYDYRISEQQARVHGFARWSYPPLFLLLVAPLAALPYLGSLLAWSTVTALPYLAALRSILGARWGWPLALAAPPTFFNLMFGQTGFLSAGLIGLGLFWLPQAPWVAGVWIGLAAFKPHLGVLLPFALLAGGHWRTCLAALLTVLGFVALSLWSLGLEPWLAFIGTAGYGFEGLAIGAYRLPTLVSPLGSLLFAGAPLWAAVAGQVGVAALGLGLLIRGWRGPAPMGLKSALLCCLAPLVTPVAYLYDLTLLVPAAAWLLRDMRDRGCRAGEVLLLGGSLALLLLAKPLVDALALQPAPLSVLALTGLCLFRMGRAPLPGRPAVG